MSRSDDLRHTLHDPDYCLGPPEPLGARVFAAIGTALGGLLCALISLGSLTPETHTPFRRPLAQGGDDSALGGCVQGVDAT